MIARLGAVLVLLALYARALTTWFQKDDFAWLGLREIVVSGQQSIWWALFAPLAQGTVRTLSERVYFLALFSLFGLNPAPYHLVGFLTCAASAVLLVSLGERLAGSRAAGFWAALLWIANSALAVPLSWIAIYYELLCALVFLSALWLLVRYVETEERRFLIGQWLVFALGFLVLELNVVYPALAALYVFIRAPKLLPKVLPMFSLSALYTLFHIIAAPLPTTGPYQLYWDYHMLHTLGVYANWALGTGLSTIGSRVLRLGLAALLASGLGWFVILKARRGQWMPAMLGAWFVIVLSPLLPLRSHLSHEYLTVPLLGPALLGGWAVAEGLRSRKEFRVGTAAMLLLYLGLSVSTGFGIARSWSERGQRAKALVLGVRDLAPVKPVVMTNIDTEMYWDVMYPRALRFAGVTDALVLANNEIGDGSQGPPRLFLIDLPAAQRVVARSEAVVYEFKGSRVRDITAEFLAISPRVELGNDLRASQLGSGWYAHETGFRWMGKTAQLTLHGPFSPKERLYVKGYGAQAALNSGRVPLRISVDGEKLRDVWVEMPGQEFEFQFDLLARFVGRPSIVVTVEVGRTFRVPPDTRDLGLPFVMFEIR